MFLWQRIYLTTKKNEGECGDSVTRTVSLLIDMFLYTRNHSCHNPCANPFVSMDRLLLYLWTSFVPDNQ